MEQVLIFEVDDFSTIVNDMVVPVHLAIFQDSSGYYLVSSSPLGGERFNGDTWHASVADALAQASWQFGVHKTGGEHLPPNDSFKPNPLRGSA